VLARTDVVQSEDNQNQDERYYPGVLERHALETVE
jgi:hypothetical protein